MTLKPSIILIIMILLAVNVISIDWWGEANAGLESTTNYYGGYSLNYPSPLQNVTNTSYVMCDLAASSFTPIAFDVTGDTFAEIITGSGSTINVYNRDCELKDIISVPAAIVSGNPGAVNVDSDSQTDLVIGTATGVYVYEWSAIQNNFVLQYSVLNTTLINGATKYISKISCPFNTNSCLGFTLLTGSTYTYLINLSSRQIKSADAHYGFLTNGDRAGVSMLRQLPTISSSLIYRIPLCSYFEDRFICDIYDETGVKLSSNQIYEYSVSTGDNTIYANSFFARMGSSLKLFSSSQMLDATQNPDDYSDGVFISSLAFTNQYTDTKTKIHYTEKIYSNWAVGDWNRDGSNEACYLYANEVTNDTYFKCVDKTFSIILDLNTTGIIDVVNNIVMADFMPDSNYTAFGTYGGVFFYNETANNMDWFYKSGYSGRSAGYPIVYVDGAAGSPLMVFTDSTAGFILKAGVIGASCGNGVCDAYENAYNCIADCNITAPSLTDNFAVGTFTKNASKCASGFIEYNKCALRPPNIVCDADSECLSGSCENNLCTDMDIWTKIDASKTQLFGDSSGANNFVSLFFILGGAFGLGLMTLNALLPIIWIVLATIGFTILGWLSPFILVGLFLIGLVVVVLGVVIGGSKG